MCRYALEAAAAVVGAVWSPKDAAIGRIVPTTIISERRKDFQADLRMAPPWLPGPDGATAMPYPVDIFHVASRQVYRTFGGRDGGPLDSLSCESVACPAAPTTLRLWCLTKGQETSWHSFVVPTVAPK